MSRCMSHPISDAPEFQLSNAIDIESHGYSATRRGTNA